MVLINFNSYYYSHLLFFFTGEPTIKSQRVSETSDDYVDLSVDALSLTNNNNTKSSLNKLNYTQIEPLELGYISMEEIIRVCLYYFLIAFIVVSVCCRVCCLQ
jgi:hypothetical protein